MVKLGKGQRESKKWEFRDRNWDLDSQIIESSTA